MSVRAAVALLLGALALSASGIGRVSFGSRCAASPARAVAAQYLVGLLAYSLMVALAAHAGLAFEGVVVLVLGFVLTGVIGVLAPIGGSRDMRVRIAAAAGIAASLFAATAAPSNSGAMDPTTYAYMTTLLFQHGWAAENLGQLSDYGWLRATSDEGVLARAASLALLWPAAALGLGVSARLVADAAAWFLLPGFAAVVDTLHGRAGLPVRIVLAAGAIGVFNELAALAGGQVNQTFALAVILGAVWACRWIESPPKQRVVLALAGANITAGYPEFLAAVPLYLVCCALEARRSIRSVIADAAALGAGWAVVQVSTRLGNLTYLVEQVDVGPGWWPLRDTPTSVADVWRYVLLERPAPWVFTLILVPMAWYAWTSSKSPDEADVGSPRLPLVAIACVGALACVWSWLALHGGNANYATFKLGGWLGPGLFLCAYLLASRGRRLFGRVGAVILIVLATGRIAGLAWDARQNLIAYASSPPARATWAIDESKSHDGYPCLVHVGFEERLLLMAALAESAAPARGCHVVVDGARATTANPRGRSGDRYRKLERATRSFE